jgi:acetylornithine/succinyldiaminopimelate/putrescine aminotransferase
VADAVAEQARTLSHVSNLYGNTLAPEVALTIDRLINGGTGQAGGQVFFTNSGAEANECALKLARRWAGPGRHVVISADNSFHGRTLATLTATGQPEKHTPFLPLPEGFVHVPYDDVAALDKALDPGTVAAVLLEPLQGEGGVMVPSSDYLGAVRALCTERHALLMLDEVQTGLGRTGHWFAFQAQGLEPDVVTMAKALGNGMPVGACWARAEVAAAFGPGDHGSTFGGQPLALAAARATLAVMEAEDVCARATWAGARLSSGLAALPGVVSVRGAGLLLAAQLDRPVAREASARALAQGLLVNAVRPDAIRVAPPLLVTDDELDAALGILDRVLRELEPVPEPVAGTEA